MSFAIRPASQRPKRRRFEPLTVVAGVFFVVAVAAAAVPAFRAGPDTGPGLLLLIGLAGVAFLGVFAFATSEMGTVPEGPARQSADSLVEALSEPSAVAGADGRLLAINAAWREMLGVGQRLP